MIGNKTYGEDITVVTLEHKVVVKLKNGVRLSPVASRILKVLLENPDKLFEFDEMIELVWGEEKSHNPTRTIRLIDHYLVHIRRFLSQSKVEYKLHRISGVGLYLAS